MSAAILERARAFDMLAPHLTKQKRAEIAEALGEKLLAEIAPAGKVHGAPLEQHVHVPDPERLKYDETAQFLADHGYSSGDQVRAAGRLEDFLKAHPTLTREAGMRVWLGRERGEQA